MRWIGNVSELEAGPIDVHAHLLPRSCYAIPFEDKSIMLEEKNPNELFLGEISIAVSSEELSDVDRLVEDMDRAGVAVRVVSAPPYAFPVRASALAAGQYCRQVNEAIIDSVSRWPTRLVPFGIVPVQDPEGCKREIESLAKCNVPGIAIPPMLGEHSLGEERLSYVLDLASEMGLSVLVHPMQLCRPGFGPYYLQNLIGNAVETGTAVASVLLSGIFERRPDLRLAFVHGAGIAPDLLGRWDHGFSERKDVSRDTQVKPSATFRKHVYADTLTHSAHARQLLMSVAGRERLLLGSDYPFDMGDQDPIGSATQSGLDLGLLRSNALSWLGCSCSSNLHRAIRSAADAEG